MVAVFMSFQPFSSERRIFARSYVNSGVEGRDYFRFQLVGGRFKPPATFELSLGDLVLPDAPV